MLVCYVSLYVCVVVFFLNDTATTEIDTYLHTLSLPDSLPISTSAPPPRTSPPRMPCCGSKARPESPGWPAISARPAPPAMPRQRPRRRSEEHTSELQSLMRISYAVFGVKKKKHKVTTTMRPMSYKSVREATRQSTDNEK